MNQSFQQRLDKPRQECLPPAERLGETSEKHGHRQNLLISGGQGSDRHRYLPCAAQRWRAVYRANHSMRKGRQTPARLFRLLATVFLGRMGLSESPERHQTLVDYMERL